MALTDKSKCLLFSQTLDLIQTQTLTLTRNLTHPYMVMSRDQVSFPPKYFKPVLDDSE